MSRSRKWIQALLERLFRRDDRPAARTPAGRKPPADGAGSSRNPPHQRHAAEGSAGQAAGGDAMEEFSALAPPTEAAPDARELREQVDRLAPLVRAHFHDHQPGPASFPPIAARIVEVIENPGVDFNQVVRLVTQDPAIAAEVLKVANSPLYRRDLDVANVRQAVTHIGLREVAGIAVTIAGRSLYNLETRAELQEFAPHFASLFHRAMTCAFGSGWLAMQAGLSVSDSAFCAGMFHGIGKPIALRSLAALRISGQVTFVVSPRAIDLLLDEVHVEMGARMHEVWSLPRRLALVCAHQRDVALAPEADLPELHIVRIVQALNTLRAGVDVHPELLELARQSLAAMRVNRFQLRALNSEIRECAQRVTTLFGVADEPPAR